MNFDVRPDFIPAEVVETPLDFKWKGEGEHIGPMETVTPLLQRLGNTTTCGQITMVAGLLLWAGCRFQKHGTVKHLPLLAQAAFAYQVDKHYLDLSGGPEYDEDDTSAATSAAFELESLAHKAMNAKQFWDRYYQPVDKTFHAAHLVNHIMPKGVKKTFEKWLDDLAGRVKQIAPKPDEEFRALDDFASEEEWLVFIARHRGTALPPQILSPNFQYDPSQHTALLGKFLSELDWNTNPFLRSPEAMLEAGFSGTPYRL